MTRTPCYHVTATDGMIYGVAAVNAQDARSYLADRFAIGGTNEAPLKAVRVAMWDASYGTVLCYGPDR